MSARSLPRACALILVVLAALLGTAATSHAAELPTDDSFGAAGSITAPLGSFLRPNEDPATTEAPDRDIVSAVVTNGFGIFSRGDVVEGPQPTPSGLIVLRYDPWGAPDTTFGGDGEVRVDGLDGGVADVRVLSDGSVLVLGQEWSRAWLVRISPSGVAGAPRTFTRSSGETECWIADATLRVDGKAVIVWYCQGDVVLQVAGVTGDSTAVSLSSTPTESSPEKVAVDPNGRYVVAFEGPWQLQNTSVRRYSAAGEQDESYGDGGEVVLTRRPQSLVIDPDGRAVVGTYVCCDGPWELHRLLSSGERDQSFGEEGVVSLDDERLGVSGPQALRTAPGGRLLATGLLGVGSGNGYVVLRLLDSGAPDESFGPGGIVELDDGRIFARGPAVAQADGNVLMTVGIGPPRFERAALPALSDDAQLVIQRYGTARHQRPAATSDSGAPGPQASSTTTTTIASTAPRTARTCLSRRNFTIRLRPKSLRSAVVRVAGKRVNVRRRGGRLTATVDLRKLKQATFKVTVVSKDRRGRTHRETRSYRTCRVGESGRKVQGGSTIVTVG